MTNLDQLPDKLPPWALRVILDNVSQGEVDSESMKALAKASPAMAEMVFQWSFWDIRSINIDIKDVSEKIYYGNGDDWSFLAHVIRTDVGRLEFHTDEGLQRAIEHILNKCSRANRLKHMAIDTRQGVCGRDYSFLFRNIPSFPSMLGEIHLRVSGEVVQKLPGRNVFSMHDRLTHLLREKQAFSYVQELSVSHLGISQGQQVNQDNRTIRPEEAIDEEDLLRHIYQISRPGQGYLQRFKYQSSLTDIPIEFEFIKKIVSVRITQAKFQNGLLLPRIFNGLQISSLEPYNLLHVTVDRFWKQTELMRQFMGCVAGRFNIIRIRSLNFRRGDDFSIFCANLAETIGLFLRAPDISPSVNKKISIWVKSSVFDWEAGGDVAWGRHVLQAYPPALEEAFADQGIIGLHIRATPVEAADHRWTYKNAIKMLWRNRKIRISHSVRV